MSCMCGAIDCATCGRAQGWHVCDRYCDQPCGVPVPGTNVPECVPCQPLVAMATKKMLALCDDPSTTVWVCDAHALAYGHNDDYVIGDEVTIEILWQEEEALRFVRSTLHKCSTSKCKRLVPADRRTCDACLASHANAYRRRYLAGLCYSCPNKREPLRVRCRSCADKVNANTRRYYKAQRLWRILCHVSKLA